MSREDKVSPRFLVTLVGQTQREQTSTPEVTSSSSRIAWESEELLDELENCSHPRSQNGQRYKLVQNAGYATLKLNSHFSYDSLAVRLRTVRVRASNLNALTLSRDDLDFRSGTNSRYEFPFNCDRNGTPEESGIYFYVFYETKDSICERILGAYVSATHLARRSRYSGLTIPNDMCTFSSFYQFHDKNARICYQFVYPRHQTDVLLIRNYVEYFE